MRCECGAKRKFDTANGVEVGKMYHSVPMHPTSSDDGREPVGRLGAQVHLAVPAVVLVVAHQLERLVPPRDNHFGRTAFGALRREHGVVLRLALEWPACNNNWCM